MAGIHQQHAGHMDTDWPPRWIYRAPVVLVAMMALVAGACSSDGQAEQTQSPPSTVRSSGALAYADTDDPGPFGPQQETPGGDGPLVDDVGDGPIPSTVPVSTTLGPDTDATDVPDQDEIDPDFEDLDFEDLDFEDEADPDFENPDDPDNAELLVERPDGIELVFADGSLASIAPRSTIDDIGRTLGPLYIITEEPFIRAGFGGGYSVSQGGEVLFWAIEENGRITTIMATNPRVGLDSGLRPTMPLIDAVALHGEPSLRLGAELREFATFADGTGSADGVSVLVAIGQFDGPVGSYVGTPQPGQETTGYQLANANIKELWFDLN
jgi:hypothetical protein